MTSNQLAKGIVKALGIVVAIILLLFFFYKIRSVLLYIAIAVVISLIGRPIILLLTKRLKLSNTLSVVITMFLLFGTILGIFRLFIPLIIKQGKNLALLDINLIEQNIEAFYHQIINYLHVSNAEVLQSIANTDFFRNLDFAFIPNFLNSLLSGLGSFSVGLFSVLFISFFFLKDNKLFERGILTFVPDKEESKWKNSTLKIKNLLSRYFIGIILQITVLFIIYTIGLSILGVENGVLIAFLCALLNLIPYIGPILGAVLMVFLSTTSYLNESFSTVLLPKALQVLTLFIIGQLIDNFISQPIIFSKSVKSHPLEIFLVILIGGVLFGIPGLILAVPIYTSIKVILKEFLSNNDVVKKFTKGI